MPNGEFRSCRNTERGFRDAIAVRVAQQRYAVGARHTGACALHHDAHDPALDAFAIGGSWRRIGFGDKHVAVRQYINPARMLEPRCVGVDCKPGRRRGCAAGGPALHRRNFDRGYQCGIRLRNDRLRPHVGVARKPRRIAAAAQHRNEQCGPRSAGFYGYALKRSPDAVCVRRFCCCVWRMLPWAHMTRVIERGRSCGPPGPGSHWLAAAWCPHRCKMRSP